MDSDGDDTPKMPVVAVLLLDVRANIACLSMLAMRPKARLSL
jgi:hypothetical protein